MENKGFKYFPNITPQNVSSNQYILDVIVLEFFIFKIVIEIDGLSFIKIASV